MPREALVTMRPTSSTAGAARADGRASSPTEDWLTPSRRMVLDLLTERGAPTSAYDIIHEISRRNGRGVAPMTVYRALAYLKSRRLVTQIELRGAYAITAHSSDSERRSLSFLCTECGSAAEIYDRRLDSAISDGARQLRFQVKQPVVEITGVCPGCRAEQAPPTPASSIGASNPSPTFT